MHHDDSAEKIRQRMAQLRRELDVDMGKVTQSARAMTDWTFYVRRFPWAAAGVAAVVGYMLIPKKKNVVAPNPETLAELVKNREVHVETASPPSEIKAILKGLMMTGVSIVARAAISHVIESLQQPKPEQSHDEPHDGASSPVEEPLQQ